MKFQTSPSSTNNLTSLMRRMGSSGTSLSNSLETSFKITLEVLSQLASVVREMMRLSLEIWCWKKAERWVRENEEGRQVWTGSIIFLVLVGGGGGGIGVEGVEVVVGGI